MKIVLRDDVANLGSKGDIVDVANGYARNYLVPRGLALPASRGVVKQAEAMRRNREVRDLRLRESAQAVADRLSGLTVEIAARAGDAGKLFGSVTAADVAARLSELLSIDIDRRLVELAEPIKELGEHPIVVRLHADVAPTVSVAIVAS